MTYEQTSKNEKKSKTKADTMLI